MICEAELFISVFEYKNEFSTTEPTIIKIGNNFIKFIFIIFISKNLA